MTRDEYGLRWVLIRKLQSGVGVAGCFLISRSYLTKFLPPGSGTAYVIFKEVRNRQIYQLV